MVINCAVGWFITIQSSGCSGGVKSSRHWPHAGRNNMVSDSPECISSPLSVTVKNFLPLRPIAIQERLSQGRWRLISLLICRHVPSSRPPDCQSSSCFIGPQPSSHSLSFSPYSTIWSSNFCQVLKILPWVFFFCLPKQKVKIHERKLLRHWTTFEDWQLSQHSSVV